MHDADAFFLRWRTFCQWGRVLSRGWGCQTLVRSNPGIETHSASTVAAAAAAAVTAAG